MRRRTVLAGLPLTLAAPAVWAQGAGPGTYPNRSITIIAAGAAGGPTDTVTRIVADSLGRHVGQSVVVEAIGGSIVGPQRLATSRPDGYTLMINNIGMASGATLYRRAPYDPLTAFAPLGLVSDAAMTIVTRRDFPAEDLRGVMAVLAREGDGINFATAGLGSAANLCALLVQGAAGQRATVVVFRGTAPAIAELMAGRIDILCDQATNTAPYIRDGRVLAHGVSSPARLAGLPNVPTTAEAGFQSISMSTWHGMYAPAGTPEPVQEFLSNALRGALHEERLKQRFAELATDPATDERASIAFHRRFLAEEIERWRPIIVANGAYAD